VIPVTLLAEDRVDPRIDFARSSAAWRWNSSGLLEEVAEDVLRADYDPNDSSFRGYLVEEERTNSLLDNRDLSTANWTGVNGATAAKNATGLDGVANSASTVSATGSTSYITQSVTVPADTNTHSAYIYVKKNQSTECELRLKLGTTPDGVISVDTGGGEVLGGRGSVESAGEFYRIMTSVVGDGSATSLELRFYPDRSGKNTDQVCDFGQLEVGEAAPSSPIETGATTVTRSDDALDMTGTNFSNMWGADEGTPVIEVEAQSTEDDTILSINDGTTDELIILEVASGKYQARIVDGGVTQATITGGAVVAGTVSRLALAYKENDIAFYQDGVQQGTDSSATIPTVTQMEFGRGFHVVSDAYYPKRIPNDDLESASTVGRDLILDPL
jgi:hypothetical protein